MQHGTPALRWGVEKRLEFIEFRLFWEGGINRGDITNFFGVSVPQASNDLAHYQELAPANIRYDRSDKRYFATSDFKPRFLKPDADRYLTQLRSIGDQVLEPNETWLSGVPNFESMPTPRRRVDPLILRALLNAMRSKRAVEIRYQSLSRPDPLWRWITPHAFGSDGLRWHVRAFCHLDHRFKDFLLPRFFETRSGADPLVGPDADQAWNEHVKVVLVPHPSLNQSQKRAVALDYGMDKESVTIQVRLALLYYFLKRLNLEGDAVARPPREQHVVVANRDEVMAAHARANDQAPIGVDPSSSRTAMGQ